MAREPEMTERELRTMVRQVVTHAERGVDVERELAAFHDRRVFDTVGQTLGEPAERRRFALLAVAASTVLVIAAGLLVLDRGDGEEISSGSGPTTILPGPTTTGVPSTTGVATSANPSTTVPPASSTSSPVQPSSTTTPTTVAPSPAFTFLEPDGGVVALAADGPFQASVFTSRFTVPVSPSEGAMWSRVTDTTFASRDIATGAVTVFDIDTGLVGTTTVPVQVGTATLRDLAVGPANTVYALYAHDLDPVTITASPLEPCPEGSSCTIADWRPGPFCESSCLLTPTETGFAWEGGTVPYVDIDGNEITGPARPIDPTFTTEYSSDSGAIPTRVDITGPAGDPQWHVRIDGVEFDNELGRSFVRQPDDSFTTRVNLAAPGSDPPRGVLLWLTEGGRVAAIEDTIINLRDDSDSFANLLDVTATADGRLVGIVYQGDGVTAVGELTPAG